MSPDVIIFSLAAAAVVAFVAYRKLNTLSSDDAHRWVAEGARLVDVRTSGEYASGHIEGAVNIPVQELPTRVGELGKDKSKAIVVYCQSGGRSSHAKMLLERAGFTKVGNLGGIGRW